MKHETFPDKIIQYDMTQISFLDSEKWDSEIDRIVNFVISRNRNATEMLASLDLILSLEFFNKVLEYKDYGIYKPHKSEDEYFVIFTVEDLERGYFAFVTSKQSIQLIQSWIDS